jgi:hypothetical protein
VEQRESSDIKRINRLKHLNIHIFGIYLAMIIQVSSSSNHLLGDFICAEMLCPKVEIWSNLCNFLVDYSIHGHR